MKVLVFGATGGTGAAVVQQALNKGFEVTAFIRNPAKLKIANPMLHVAEGDVLQQETVDDAVAGHDAVICCLRAPATKAGTLRSHGTKNIVKAMQRHAVQRFICQTSLGYGDSLPVLEQTPFFFKKIIVPYLLKETFADYLLQENIIKETNLNWTIIRPGTLTNGKLTGHYQYGFDYTDTPLQVKVSRADVADFIVGQLGSEQYEKKVAGISYW